MKFVNPTADWTEAQRKLSVRHPGYTLISMRCGHGSGHAHKHPGMELPGDETETQFLSALDCQAIGVEREECPPADD